MRESFPDADPISDFPSESEAEFLAADRSRPSAASQSTFFEVLPVPGVKDTPLVEHPPRVGRDVRQRSTARTTAFQRWIPRITASIRRAASLLPPMMRASLLPPMMRYVGVVRRSLPAIITSRPYRPVLSTPLAAFCAGLTLGALVMWTTPARTDDDVAPPESNSVDAAQERRPITLAGIGDVSRSTATSGSPSLTPSPAPVDTVAGAAALPRTIPPVQDTATRRPLEPVVRQPAQRPSPVRRQAAAARPAATARTGYRGSLSVRSRPEGASVFINGRPVGTTPLVLKNEAVGSRAVRVTLNGYDSWTTAARVVADRQTTLSADLRSLPRR